ncbi:MAG TPA: type II secretion system protein GspM [Stellaceae bacterium]|jgi:general secretion pathway protein M|nr:type II secretion system protein GspM [Stellaceae bacterium]
MFTTPWLSRAAALLLLAAVLAVAYVWIVEPIAAAYANTEAAIADTRDLVERYDRLAAARASLEAQLAAIEQKPDTAAYYLSGATDALAAASLQARVTALVEGSGATLLSIQTLTSTEDRGLRRVAIRLQMTAEIAPLVRVLHGLESGIPLLFVDNLELQSQAAPAIEPDAAETSAPLIVGFDLYGYLPPVQP